MERFWKRVEYPLIVEHELEKKKRPRLARPREKMNAFNSG
jgi:hypothetical protein